MNALLQRKEFEKISVGDIAEEAEVNRATFYDHYSDKYVLLESLVRTQFNELIAERGIVLDGGCDSALVAIVLGVCDFVASGRRLECERQRQMKPHYEAAVISIVRQMLLEGLALHPTDQTGSISQEMIASAASWAIYGAASEWANKSGRVSSEAISPVILALVRPILASKVEETAV